MYNRIIALIIFSLFSSYTYAQEQQISDKLQTMGVSTGFALAVIPINLNYSHLKLNKSGDTFTGFSTGLSYMMASGFLDDFGTGQFGGHIAFDMVRNMKRPGRSGSTKEFEFRLGFAYYLKNPNNSNWLSIKWWPLLNIGTRIFYKNTHGYFRIFFGTGGIGIGFGRRLGI